MFKKKPPSNDKLTENFLRAYPPGPDLVKPDAEILKFGRKMLPPEILYLWETYGFGSYGDGILKLVDPRDYMESLYKWLGKTDQTRIPILVSAFADLFYYRKLERGESDVSLLDIHYGNISVCAWSCERFLNGFLLEESTRRELLREELYREAVQALGPLKQNEAFFFVPALFLGGGEKLKYVKKGDAAVHQEVLLYLRNRQPG